MVSGVMPKGTRAATEGSQHPQLPWGPQGEGWDCLGKATAPRIYRPFSSSAVHSRGWSNQGLSPGLRQWPERAADPSLSWAPQPTVTEPWPSAGHCRLFAVDTTLTPLL